MGTGVRLQKVLARAGVASRRGAESLILEGRVRVNGVIVSKLGAQVDPERDTITVDGRSVRIGEARWVVLHKPRGYVCTRRDEAGRPTVYDLLPESMHSLFTVGRLDMDSEGLILLTNDGDAAHRLLHPRYGADRVYEVETARAPSAETLARLRRGVRLEDGTAQAREAALLPASRTGRSRLRLLLREGRKREVRRMLEAVGHPVLRLRRVRYGPVSLGRLGAGDWRALRAAELEALAERASAPAPTLARSSAPRSPRSRSPRAAGGRGESSR
ncbi:MAG: rRNA pseudouridine synthase [Gemmatimonadetes bacterium]|nr:rRNA pseudouridine synthase [Gemmatimonadota bacterium]